METHNKTGASGFQQNNAVKRFIEFRERWNDIFCSFNVEAQLQYDWSTIKQTYIYVYIEFPFSGITANTEVIIV
jgi:hypothetical protein